MEMRLDEIRPNFDVFSLGKVLWSMISGLPKLNLWYFDRSQYNVEELHKDASHIELINPILHECVVENEEDCLPDAHKLLEKIDEAISIIEEGACKLGDNIERPCRVCGAGEYGLVVNGSITELRNWGLNPCGTNTYKFFACSHCGHVQLFASPKKDFPAAWD
jgi:hypothetical protein